MERLRKLKEYNEKCNPDEHVQLFDEHLNYFHTDEASKCKSLPNGSIESWIDLYESLNAHFTAQKKQLLTIVSLSGTTHGKKERLWLYINHFTRVEMEVERASA